MQGNSTVNFCPRCGNQCEGQQQFCSKCGNPLGGGGIQQYPPASVGRVQPPQKNNNVIYIVLGIVVALLIAVSAFLVYSIVVSNNDEGVQETVAVENHADLSDKLNNYIAEHYATNDISVAVYDNLSGRYYSSANSQQRYVAWGLYLPVYLAYSRYWGSNSSVLNNILSSDPGVCNNNANSAIRDWGGLYSLNSWLEEEFDVNATSYGRYFGDTSSSYENYTSASEALKFLKAFNENDYYGKLTYNLSSFSIAAPSTARVYAQIGTENRNVRKEMNFFGIVKGDNSDYCVAILTKNSASSRISDVLALIHYTLESGE